MQQTAPFPEMNFAKAKSGLRIENKKKSTLRLIQNPSFPVPIMQFSKDFSLILYYTWVYITINSQQNASRSAQYILHPLYSFHTCAENDIKHRVSSPADCITASLQLLSPVCAPVSFRGGRRKEGNKSFLCLPWGCRFGLVH